MSTQPPSISPDELKRAAAIRALDFVTPGMRLGLGTGSTARHFVEVLGARACRWRPSTSSLPST